MMSVTLKRYNRSSNSLHLLLRLYFVYGYGMLVAEKSVLGEVTEVADREIPPDQLVTRIFQVEMNGSYPNHNIYN